MCQTESVGFSLTERALANYVTITLNLTAQRIAETRIPWVKLLTDFVLEEATSLGPASKNGHRDKIYQSKHGNAQQCADDYGSHQGIGLL